MPELWYHLWFRLIQAVYFARIKLVHGERLPKSGPILYLGLHRNGAVDGFVYQRVLPQPVFLISTQLRKSFFARLFFHGIAVTRTRDEGDRNLNDGALQQSLAHLRSGGELFVFPEGTSSLRPGHLPFKSGAVWLLLDYLAAGGPPLQVVPLGIHYECPQAFQSRVEVIVGQPISTDLPAGASQLERLRELKRRVKTALEEVGTNVPSEAYQVTIQQLAYVATLGTRRSYSKTLKLLEQSIPPNVLAAWNELQPELRNHKLLLHQGVPLFPLGSVALYCLALVLFAPIVTAAMLLNLPPLLAGWFAGEKFPDDRNVVSLWKILIGIPVFALWFGVITLLLILLGNFWLLLGYSFITVLGLKSYYRVKKLAVATHNGLCHPKLRPRMLAFRETLLASLPDED